MEKCCPETHLSCLLLDEKQIHGANAVLIVPKAQPERDAVQQGDKTWMRRAKTSQDAVQRVIGIKTTKALRKCRTAASTLG